mmetsp:Transcript_2007/g.4097  ORF Transcript_2007/g.4097 Transcript_2007/m.4097 type:complete len:530 (-) Transcript_2007:103-1692(-)
MVRFVSSLVIATIVASVDVTTVAGEVAAAVNSDVRLSKEQLQHLTRFRNGELGKDNVEIVVASCGDDVSWLRSEYESLATINDQCTIASKVSGQNVGRESHVFLKHIVDNYDKLAEWTVFTQGHAPAAGYNELSDEGTTRGGHMLKHATFDDYVLAGERGEPLYMPITSAVQIGDHTNYRHAVRSMFGDTSIVPESRSAWGVSVCPESSPVDGSSNPAEVDADRFMPWFDMEVAPKDETKFTFTRLYEALERETFRLSALDERNPVSGLEARPLTAQEYFTTVLGHAVPKSGILLFGQGARFGVSADSLRSKPKAYYLRLLNEVSGSNDPYQGYYNEWMWPWIVADSATVKDQLPCELPPLELADNVHAEAPNVGRMLSTWSSTSACYNTNCGSHTYCREYGATGYKCHCDQYYEGTSRTNTAATCTSTPCSVVMTSSTACGDNAYCSYSEEDTGTEDTTDYACMCDKDAEGDKVVGGKATCKSKYAGSGGAAALILVLFFIVCCCCPCAGLLCVKASKGGASVQPAGK